MASVFVSPGVYTREIDLSLYVPALSSSIFGIVGTATKGPINKVVTVTSALDFSNRYGRLNTDSMLGYAAQAFLKRGHQLKVVRVAGPSAAKADASVAGGPSTGSVLGTNAEPFTITGDTAAEHTGTELGDFTIASTNDTVLINVPGASGTPFTVTLTSGSRTAAQIASEINAGTVGINASATTEGAIKIVSTATGSTAQFEIRTVATDAYSVLGLSVGTFNGASGENSLVISIDGGSDDTITLTPGTRTAAQIATEITTGLTSGLAETINGAVRIRTGTIGSAGSVQVQTTSTADTVLGFSNTVSSGSAGGATTGTVYAQSEGEWGNNLRIRVQEGSVFGTFRITVFDGTTSVENWDMLSKDPDSTSFWETVIGSSATLADGSIPSEYIYIDDDATELANPAVTTTNIVLSGGENGISDVTDAHYAGTVTGTTRTGLELLSNPEDEDVNILAVPGISSSTVVTKLISVSETRGDSLSLIDPPFGLSRSQVEDWHNGRGSYTDHSAFNSSYAAAYWPWVQIFDADNNQRIWVPPSGEVAAQMAFTDYIAAPWYAPAGLVRGRLTGVLRTEYAPNRGDRDSLYGNGNSVNPIVNFPNQGIVIWGQRTLQRTPTALDRINVRRLLLQMRKVIATVMASVVFEPNDEPTRRRIRNTLTPTLNDFQARRGLQAFQLVVDETNNPPAAVDRGELHITLYIRPTKAAEILVFNVVVTDQGTSFAEVVNFV